MDVVDALLFALLAVGDMALIVYLRKRRTRRLRDERMAQCLVAAVRRELQSPAPRPRMLRRPPMVGAELLASPR